jgi:hypothetical protein
MDNQTPQPRTDLKARLLQLLQAGARGAVLASLTLATQGNAEAARSDEKPSASLEERVEKLRQQKDSSNQPAARPVESGDLLAWGNWGNWHNWRNGWHNGWHNWHNWHNW